MKRSTVSRTQAFWRSASSSTGESGSSLFSRSSLASRSSSSPRFPSQQSRGFAIRAISANSVILSAREGVLPFHHRYYSSAVATPEPAEIKEIVSPVFYERRIADLWSAAERNVEEEKWTKAEDRLFTVLENVDHLKTTLKDLGKGNTAATWAKK